MASSVDPDDLPMIRLDRVEMAAVLDHREQGSFWLEVWRVWVHHRVRRQERSEVDDVLPRSVLEIGPDDSGRIVGVGVSAAAARNQDEQLAAEERHGRSA